MKSIENNRLGPLIALATLLTLLAAACGTSGHHAAAGPRPSTPPPSPQPTATSTSTSTPASGCRTAGPAPSGSTTIPVDGRQRVVIVHLPKGYRSTAPSPLVLNMHGSGSTAAQQELLSGMDATADRYGFVVAYPQGLIAAGAGFDWNIPGVPLVGGSYPPKGAADDVAFLSTLVTEMEARYCIDPHRVYATGLSGGGRMASQLGCDEAGVFAAVAPVAGLRFPSPCPATRAVPVIAFHGSADPIDPYQGNGQAYWTYSVPTAAQRWAAHDGCPARTPPPPTAGAGYTLTTYAGCAAGSAVELYTVTGEGHEWPGGPTLPRPVVKLLGPQSAAVDADTAMWEFFAAHPNA